MVILCASHHVPSVHSEFPPGWLSLNNSSRVCRRMHSTGRKLGKQNRHHRMISFDKSSSLRDSMASIKPSRLLPTVELNTFPNSIPEEIISTVRLGESDAFYTLELSTSGEFLSLLDKNAAILICLIDVDGYSLLQRVPAIYWDQPAQAKKTALLPGFKKKKRQSNFFPFKAVQLMLSLLKVLNCKELKKLG